jgi:hypothetical protein
MAPPVSSKKIVANLIKEILDSKGLEELEVHDKNKGSLNRSWSSYINRGSGLILIKKLIPHNLRVFYEIECVFKRKLRFGTRTTKTGSGQVQNWPEHVS